MADHLASVVRAATAAKAGAPWESALRCRRRPGRRACPGHIAVFRADLPAPIEWQCTACGDDGVISGWEDSYFDLHAPRSEPPEDVQIDIVVSDVVAAALRDLRYLDTGCERLVFRARAGNGGVVVTGSRDEIDELIDAVAAEANHETDRRRTRLDAAFTALSDAPEVDTSDVVRRCWSMLTPKAERQATPPPHPYADIGTTPRRHRVRIHGRGRRQQRRRTRPFTSIRGSVISRE
jgi:hypothetical protein